MQLDGKWVSDIEVLAIRHLLDRPVGPGGLSVREMNALANLTRKGLVTYSHSRGGAYRPSVRLLNALTIRAQRKGLISVDRAEAVRS